MTATKPQVTAYCDTDLIHAAYAVAGLIELADAGEIDLQFRFRDPTLHRPQGHWAFWLRVQEDAGDYGICIDCHDSVKYFCPDSLATCRYYFKANLNAETFARAPVEHRPKLRPFGPYFPCRPQHDRNVRLRWLGSTYIKIRERLVYSTRSFSFLDNLRAIHWDLRRAARYRSRNLWEEYESRPLPPSDEPNFIVFNPSCSNESEGEDIRRMNEFRSDLILALRDAFGPRFYGGLRREGPYYPRYPEALEPQHISHDEYLRLLARSQLAVYTNGRWGCLSWRLAETLAASKCIVSQLIPNDTGVPLDENVGVLQRRTVDEMITALLELDKDPHLTAEYRRRAHRYYVDQIRPQSRMRLLLAEARSPIQTSGVAFGNASPGHSLTS